MTAHVTAPPGTVLGPASRRADGRWVVGYCDGPSGRFPVLLHEGADPSALTPSELQEALDAAGQQANRRPEFTIEYSRGTRR